MRHTEAGFSFSPLYSLALYVHSFSVQWLIMNWHFRFPNKEMQYTCKKLYKLGLINSLSDHVTAHVSSLPCWAYLLAAFTVVDWNRTQVVINHCLLLKRPYKVKPPHNKEVSMVGWVSCRKDTVWQHLEPQHQKLDCQMNVVIQVFILILILVWIFTLQDTCMIVGDGGCSFTSKHLQPLQFCIGATTDREENTCEVWRGRISLAPLVPSQGRLVPWLICCWC